MATAEEAMVAMLTAATVPGDEKLVAELWAEACQNGMADGVLLVTIFSFADVLKRHAKATGIDLRETLVAMGVEAALHESSS